jgi:nucleoside-diphosphate-sugar epimerase
MMNILVIGGSGLFGHKISVHLIRDKDVGSVVSMDVRPPPDWVMKAIQEYSHKFHYVLGDVSQLEDILDTLKKYAIDRIVNMAFILTGAFELDPRLAVKVNALGMCNVFEAARLMGLARVVYASSVAVYGPQSEYGDREVNEDDQLHPGNGYGVTKQLDEIVAAQYAKLYNLKLSAIRPFLGYGHGGNFPPIIKQFSDLISLPAVGKAYSTQMDGLNPSALSSAEDVAALIRTLIKADSSPHPVYNIASSPTTMRDLARAVLGYIPDARLEFGRLSPPPEAAKFGLPWKVSMARAREDLGFSLLPLREVVLEHINDARLQAGLEPIKPLG